VWHALATRQRAFAIGDDRARRVDRAIGLFAAAADAERANLAALADLVPEGGVIGLVETRMPPLPDSLRIVKAARCVQMIATDVRAAPDLSFQPLGADDAADMLALATLTEPGPFFARTNELGDFIGIRHERELVAMAGERMMLPGFTEVSGVCTRPGFRGRGYAAGLLSAVAVRIVARGETPFLHAYADHKATIALYEKLGFSVRATVTYALVARA
jgi:predicted GNAT family acetyltransferase